MRNISLSICATLFWSISSWSLPEESIQVPEMVAIQERANYLSHDLSFMIGALPSDAFNKGITLGASYTYFLSPYSAWEVIELHGNLNFETQLKKDFLDLNIDITNNSLGGKLDPIQGILTTSYVYTPFYSKSLLFNESLVHSETSFVAGLGTVKFQTEGFQPLVSIGAYSRWFTSASRSLKLSLRWNFHVDGDQALQNFFHIGFAYSMQLGEAPAHLTKEKTP